MSFSYQRHLQCSLFLVGAMACLPFLNPHHYNPIPSFYAEWWAGLLGLLASSLFLREPARQDLRLPLGALIPFALIALFLFQLVAGKVHFLHQGLLFCLYLIWACLMLLLGRVLVREASLERLAQTLSIGFLCGGLMSLLIVGLQLYRPDWLGLEFIFPTRNGQVFANLGQRNQFADYLWLGVLSAIYLQARQRLRPWQFLLVAIPLALCAVFTASRSVYLYIAATAILSFPMGYRQSDFASIRKGTGWVIAVALLVEIAKHFGDIGDMVMITAGERLYSDPGGISTRFALWQIAWNSFLQAPLLGVGLGGFSWQTFVLADSVPPGSLPGAAEHAHNLFAQLLAEFGIASLLTLMLVGVALWREFRKQAWGHGHWWGLAAITIIGLHSQLEYPLWYAFFLGPMAILLGALAPRPISIDLGKLGPRAMALLLLAGIWIMGNLYRDYSLLEDTMHWRDIDTTQQASWPEVHTRLSKLYGESLFPHYVQLYYALAAPISPDNLEEKLAITADSLLFSPVDRLVFKYPALLALAGRQDEAQQMLQLAILAYPARVPAALRQVRVLADNYPEIRTLAASLEKAEAAARQPPGFSADAAPQTPPSPVSGNR